MTEQDISQAPVDKLTGKPIIDTVIYDNKIVAKFLWASIIWGLVGFAVGILLALQLAGMGTSWGVSAFGWLNTEYFSFGRLRPLHTNAVIFAFTGNIIFAGVYYSLQRLLKARMFCDKMSFINFWGWQLIIVAAAITLPLGITSGKEYAELEWPIDIAIAVVWVIFGLNMIMTIIKRRERHLYVAIWFYIATWAGIAMLHIVNSIAIPVDGLKSYSAYAGVQDALVQWWYGHNAVAFFLTTPILGLMYYYLPKAAERPVYSYRLSIIHFWSLVFIYIWAGPHHLLHTSLPGWAQSLGVTFSIMLIMPSWGGMLNGLLTLRGAWDKVRADPVLKFFVAAVTFYGMSTFEGPMMSLREVNALSHNTDWTIGHVHSGALGWVGCMAFGVIYWLIPQVYKVKLFSKDLANYHFWLATFGIILYIIGMWISGLTQGAMWFAFTEDARLMYPDWIEILNNTMLFQWVRAFGGILYITGMVLLIVNVCKTVKASKGVEDDEIQALPLWTEPEPDVYVELAKTKNEARPWIARMNVIHAAIERWPITFIILTGLALSVGSICEIVPNMVQGALTPKIESVKPYTPLELAGRDIYIREGCVSCHTQMVRTLRADTARYGEYTRPGEGIYERPFLWGSKRTGPDLMREGIIKSGDAGAVWHWQHMYDPQITSENSIMPAYAYLYEDDTDYASLTKKLSALHLLGTPYEKETIANAEQLARDQAKQLALMLQEKVTKVGLEPALPDKVEDKEIIALIAYLQRLGTDLEK